MTQTTPGDLNYRAALPDDVAWLADVFIGSLRDPITMARGEWNEERERAQFLRQLRLPDTAVILAETTPIGFYTAKHERGGMFLHTLCISPGYQNKGYGTNVMRALAQRTSPIRMLVLKSNPGARRFYERLGYRWMSATQHHDELKSAESER